MDNVKSSFDQCLLFILTKLKLKQNRLAAPLKSVIARGPILRSLSLTLFQCVHTHIQSTSKSNKKL